jgi:hypothetical protein
MNPKMENPAALAACGVSRSDLAGASINSVDTNSRPLTQAEASQLARIVFGCDSPPLKRGVTGIGQGHSLLASGGRRQ